MFSIFIIEWYFTIKISSPHRFITILLPNNSTDQLIHRSIAITTAGNYQFWVTAVRDSYSVSDWESLPVSATTCRGLSITASRPSSSEHQQPSATAIKFPSSYLYTESDLTNPHKSSPQKGQIKWTNLIFYLEKDNPFSFKCLFKLEASFCSLDNVDKIINPLYIICWPFEIEFIFNSNILPAIYQIT